MPVSLLLAKLVTYGSEEEPQAMFKDFDIKSGRVYMRVGISYWWVARQVEVDHGVKGTIGIGLVQWFSVKVNFVP